MKIYSAKVNKSAVIECQNHRDIFDKSSARVASVYLISLSCVYNYNLIKTLYTIIFD